jgi:signal transduction histidine kinase/CheY-like chemotaxis protein
MSSMRTIEQIAGIGSWEMTLPDRTMTWSAGACELLFAQTAPAATFDEFLSCCHPDDRAAVSLAFDAALKTDSHGLLRVEHRAEVAFSMRWFAQRAEACRDANGQVTALAGVLRDITDDHQASAELARTAQLLETAITAGGVGVWDWDVGHNALVWDAVMFRLYGLKPQAFSGAYQGWMSAVHPQDKDRVDGDIRAALHGEREYRPRFRVVWPDGSVHHLKAAARVSFDARGNAVRMTGVNYDLSDQVAIEEALERSRTAAEAANRAKSAFLANMSHEIRTPMNAVTGLSALGLGLPDLPPKASEYLNRIHTSSKALLSIINDILAYSKLDADRVVLEQVEFSVTDVLNEVISLFALGAHEKHVELILAIDPKLPERVVGDPLRLIQVLNNLVGNAVKFTESGHICLHADATPPQPGDAAAMVRLRLAVEDTGIGIAPSDIAQLFKPFTQADVSISRRFGGSGLGLVISKRLLELMGGEIDIDSKPGQGSIFSSVLPLTVVRSVGTLTHTEQLAGQRMLIVDDNGCARRTLGDMLATWGVNVTEATSGADAIKRIERSGREPGQLFDVVLIDWKMPEMDGLKLAHWIHETVAAGSLAEVAVVMMATAFDQDALLAESRGLHLDGVLSKPLLAAGVVSTLLHLGELHPAKPPGSDPLAGLFERAAPIHGAHVLVVEDLADNQWVARDMLERMGLRVTVADHGEQALQLLEKTPFDMVLMDLQMPLMDGVEATRHIRERGELADLPVLAMTAAVLDHDREACEAAGMMGIVGKPIEPPLLLDELLKWIRPRAAQGGASPEAGATPEAPAFPVINGIDSADAARRMLGNVELFHRLLVESGTACDAAMLEAQAALARGDRAEAAARIHALRGMLGNLSAHVALPLAEQAEAGLRSTDEPAPAVDLQPLDKVVAELAVAIRAHLALTPETGPPP